ncbi:MAG: GIY-YIG nuclease family protein [bacterium]|nr:GIY-YIG nuclease family protein [bacterium]
MTKKYYTYLARCSDGSLYTGYCVNLSAREAKHNAGEAARYTRQRRPVKILYFEEFETRTEAMRRERQIKGWNKNKKESLVQYGHPTKLTGALS